MLIITDRDMKNYLHSNFGIKEDEVNLYYRENGVVEICIRWNCPMKSRVVFVLKDNVSEIKREKIPCGVLLVITEQTFWQYVIEKIRETWNAIF